MVGVGASDLHQLRGKPLGPFLCTEDLAHILSSDHLSVFPIRETLSWRLSGSFTDCCLVDGVGLGGLDSRQLE